MQVSFVQPEKVSDHEPDELPALLERDDGFVWVDVPVWDDAAEAILADVFGCHPLVVDACRHRNHVPTVHVYEHHIFVILHSPLPGTSGHVHLLELCQIVGLNYLVTVHGPFNPAVDPAVGWEVATAVRRRIEQGRFHPSTPGEVSYALGTAVARNQRGLISTIAERLPALEEQVMEGEFRTPEILLEKLFLVRHELLTGLTMASQSHDVYARIASLERSLPEADRPRARDLAEQFDRVRGIADGENQFLSGVIELYETRATTKMTVAMERLAVIAAVTLPITALASVYGMNVIVNERTNVGQLAMSLLAMAIISGLLLRWTKRQGWW
jgi:Mg2+ and Co2+ transporter CorA